MPDYKTFLYKNLPLKGSYGCVNLRNLTIHCKKRKKKCKYTKLIIVKAVETCMLIKILSLRCKQKICRSIKQFL